MYAHNTGAINYGMIAAYNSILIKRQMDKPVAVVCDGETYEMIKSIENRVDMFIIRDSEEQTRLFKNGEYLPYKNGIKSAMITPFEENLIIDCDYLVLDDSLNGVWGSYSSIRMNTDVTYIQDISNIRKTYIHDMTIPLYWATVFYCKADSCTYRFFKLVEHVKKNYEYYSLLYKYPTGLYRNDFSYSIAAHILSGYVDDTLIQPLPVPFLVFSEEEHEIIHMDNARILFDTKTDVPVNYPCDYSVHIMNKFTLQEKIGEIYRNNRI